MIYIIFINKIYLKIMNIVISKLNLPCDLKYVITSFVYDKLGYSYEQLQEIEKSKKNKEMTKLRQKFELHYWKNSECGIQWLKPTKTLVRGAYLNKLHELNTIIEFRYITSREKVVELIESMFIPKNNPYVYTFHWDFDNPRITYSSILRGPSSLLLI